MRKRRNWEKLPRKRKDRWLDVRHCEPTLAESLHETAVLGIKAMKVRTQFHPIEPMARS